ncbi:MAG: phosphatidate cytidylyltransferase [Clostridia bacterium]|nr:phosphatidate cytidylyltransferase [Clostridia bacterium]
MNISIALKEKQNQCIGFGYLACFLISLIHIVPRQYIVITIGVLVPTSILLLFIQVIISNMKTTIKDIAITFFGICYIPLFLMYMPLLMGSENGKLLVWYIIISAWGTDIFAFIVGRTIGKHTFSKISPNKSIEGCLGGTIGATTLTLIYTFIINTCLGMNINYLYIGAISILLSIIGQIGDFSASSIKRYVGIKDFSNLLPGHGGMLDRIDSLIFITPFAYFLLLFVL